MNPEILIAVIFAVNLPFGAWRSAVRRFSPSWFVAVHVPVIIAIILRIISGNGFHLTVFALSVAAFSLGQLSGGWLYSLFKGSTEPGKLDV